MYTIAVEEGRKAPASLVATEAESIELYGGLFSYAGTYSIQGNKISHYIDASWNQAWTGTTQVPRVQNRWEYVAHQDGAIGEPADRQRELSRVLTWTKVE